MSILHVVAVSDGKDSHGASLPAGLAMRAADVLKILTGYDTYSNLQSNYGLDWRTAIDTIQAELRAAAAPGDAQDSLH